jgi:hypothetical protein
MTVSSPVPPPPGSPPPRKGLSPLAWVGIGCGVIIVLAMIVLGVLGFFVKKKADEISKNPTMAAAKIAVQLNPDLELVSADEAHNTLTIKDKKTGEVVTFNAEDIKNGKLTIKSNKNGTTTFDGSSTNGGSLKVTNDKGEVSTFNGGGTPQNLPSWLPVYPGGAVQGTFDTTSAEGRSAAFTVTTTDAVSKVMDFYETQFKGAGLKVDKSTFSSNGQDGGTLSAKSDDDKRQASVLLGTADGKTSATVTFQEKK